MEARGKSNHMGLICYFFRYPNGVPRGKGNQTNAIVQGPQTKPQNESIQIQGWNPAFETSHSGEFGLIRTNILSRFGLNWLAIFWGIS